MLLENEKMNRNTFVSIIVPVYNTPIPLLKSCFDSVTNQTNKMWELIAVDDGSDKECADFLDTVCKSMPNTKIFHKKNGGVSSARNLGISEAKGEWITFLDSDNTLPLNAVQIYYDTVSFWGDEDTDMVIGFCTRGTRIIENGIDNIKLENSSINNLDCNVEVIKDKNELVNHFLTNRVKRWTNRNVYFADGPVSKLVKNKFAKNVLFPLNLKWEEDTVWLLDFVSRCNKILITNGIVYNTIDYEFSATRRFRFDCLTEFYDVCIAEKEMQKQFPDCMNAFAYKRFSNILLVARLYFFHKDNIESERHRYNIYIKWCKNPETEAVINDVLKYIKENNVHAFVYKFFSYAFKLRLYLFCWKLLKIYCEKR